MRQACSFLNTPCGVVGRTQHHTKAFTMSSRYLQGLQPGWQSRQVGRDAAVIHVSALVSFRFDAELSQQRQAREAAPLRSRHRSVSD